MPTLIAYRKYVTLEVTRELRLPEDAPTRQRLGTELATIDGITYVSLPDGATLPAEQPPEIAASIETITLTPSLREAIKAASPHCRLIAATVVEKIRAAYTLDDEMYFARIGAGASIGLYTPTEEEMHMLTVFGVFVEDCRAWGRQQKAALGL